MSLHSFVASKNVVEEINGMSKSTKCCMGVCERNIIQILFLKHSMDCSQVLMMFWHYVIDIC